MRQIEILGTGCAKCNNLALAAEAAAKATGEPYTLEKVTDLRQIMAHGVMLTPALVVDGQVKVAGRVPSVEQIAKMLA